MSAPFGRYETTVEGTHFAFNPPSENGGHEGMRFLELADADTPEALLALRQGESDTFEPS